MYLEDLSNNIWATKEARFEASRRMRRNRIASTAATYLLSASIIAINLFAFLPHIESSKEYQIVITVLTVILSIFCLVITAIVNSQNYSKKEEQLHDCGLALQTLNSKIQQLIRDGKNLNEVDNEPFIKEYNEILLRFKQNHTLLDSVYARYLDERKKRKWTWNGCLSLESIRYYLRSIRLFIRWNILDVYLIYWIIAIVPVIAIIYFFLHFI